MRRIAAAQFDEQLGRILAGVWRYGPPRVVLHGSFARGDCHALSDIDLVIIKDTDRPFVDRIGDVLALCDYAIPLEPLVYTPAEFEQMRREGNRFIEQVLKDGKVVYESQCG